MPGLIPTPTDPWTISTRDELSQFVEATPESETLEYKGLRDLMGCGSCAYCSDPVTGSRIARTVGSLALRHGGILIIGAKIVDRNSGKHALEMVACSTTKYTPEEVENRVSRLTSPPIRPEVRAITKDGGPPAFVVRVRAGLRLQGWRENPGGYPQFSRRGGASTAILEVDQIESVVRHLDHIADNAPFRGEVRNEILGLYYHVFERPGVAGPWDHLTVATALAWDPCGASHLIPTARGHDLFHDIEAEVLQIPSKIATLHAPGDIARAVVNLTDIGQFVAHSGLSIEESRLLAATHRLSLHEKLYEWLTPVTDINVFAGTHADRVRQELYSAPYTESYSHAFDRVAPSTGNPNFDARLKRQAIGGMVEVLSDLVPLSYRVLKVYDDLEREYGPGAIPP